MAQELNIRLNSDEKKPLYRQIYEYIRGEIRSGSLEAGERLPSTRALASGLHVARSTAELAYSQLLSEGYIRAKKNSGFFVNEIENLAELHFEVQTADGTDSGTMISADAAERKGHKSEEEKQKLLNSPAVPLLSRLGKQSAENSGMIDFSLRHTEMSVFRYST